MIMTKKVEKQDNKTEEKVTRLLEDIKKLIILDLIIRGVQAKDVAQILGVNQSTVSRMVPSRLVKK